MHAGKTPDVSQDSPEKVSADQPDENLSSEFSNAENIDIPDGLLEIDLPLDDGDSADSVEIEGGGIEPVAEEIDIEEIEAALAVDSESDGDGDASAEPPPFKDDRPLIPEVEAESDEGDGDLADGILVLDVVAEDDEGGEALPEPPESMDDDILVLDEKVAADEDDGDLADDALVLDVAVEGDDEPLAEPSALMADDALFLDVSAEADEGDGESAGPLALADDDALVLEMAVEADEGGEAPPEPPESMDDDALVLETEDGGALAEPLQLLDDDAPVLEMASKDDQEALVLEPAVQETQGPALPEFAEGTGEDAPELRMAEPPGDADADRTAPSGVQENDSVFEAGEIEPESDDFDLEITEEEIVEEAPAAPQEAAAPDESVDLSFGIEIEPVRETGRLSHAPKDDGPRQPHREDLPVAEAMAWGACESFRDNGPVWKRSVTMPVWWIALMVAALGIGVGVMALGRTGSSPFSAVNVSVVSTEGRIVENIHHGPVYVVSGRVKNGARKTQNRILVQGRIFTRNGFSKTVQAFAGHDLPEAELAAMPPGPLLAKLADPPHTGGGDVLLPAGETLAFVLVFTGLPQDLTALEKYTVAVIAAGP